MSLFFLLALIGAFTFGMLAQTTKGSTRVFFGVLFLVALFLCGDALVKMFLTVLPQ